jgi:hypothetical protein
MQVTTTTTTTILTMVNSPNSQGNDAFVVLTRDEGDETYSHFSVDKHSL